jgi:hypothetical protein
MIAYHIYVRRQFFLIRMVHGCMHLYIGHHLNVHVESRVTHADPQTLIHYIHIYVYANHVHSKLLTYDVVLVYRASYKVLISIGDAERRDIQGRKTANVHRMEK